MNENFISLYLCNGVYKELVLDVYETNMAQKSETCEIHHNWQCPSLVEALWIVFAVFK